MHGDYLYTLPFHFDYLYECYDAFIDVKSNNPDVLINNHRIWHNVKSIELYRSKKYNLNFVNELKIKMPKLNLTLMSYYYPTLSYSTFHSYSW